MTLDTLKHDQTETAERPGGGLVFRPHVDILERSDELTIVADVPGVKHDTIDIRFEDGVLTLQGTVAPRYGEGKKFLLSEYGIGDFHRTFQVSELVDANRITGECVDGVLTVHLPKAEKAKPRKIEVKSG
jgi:HSP20 family protein